MFDTLQTLVHFPAPFMGADRRVVYMWTKVQSTVNLPFSQEADRPGGMRSVINPMGMFTIFLAHSITQTCKEEKQIATWLFKTI